MLGLGRQYGIGPVGDVLLASGQIACGVLCITRARVAASGRGAWRALGIGVVVWALGDVLLRHGGLIGEPAERAVARGLWLDGLAAGLASAALVLQPLREVAPDPLTAVLYPLGCDVAQGYHLSPPLSPAGLDRWLEGSGVAVAASDP